MPKITAVIEGREYSFAPLTYGEWEDLADEQLAGPLPLVRKFRNWVPRIGSSLKRAGCEMPNIHEMDVDRANSLLADMINAVLEASGLIPAQPGEVHPAAVSGTSATTSSVSS